MVTIERAGHVLTVTQGAFKALYRPMGYVIVGAEGGPEASPVPGGVTTTPDTETGLEGPENVVEDDSQPDDEPVDAEDDTEEDTEDEDLDEKPLSEMNFKELKAYAAKRGINVNGMSSKKEVREAILEAEEED